jgi:hypothetical protein
MGTGGGLAGDRRADFAGPVFFDIKCELAMNMIASTQVRVLMEN